MNNRRIPSVAGALALCGLLAACGDNAPPPEEPLRPVRTMTVPEEIGARTRTFTGVARSAQESRLSFKVTGTILELPVEVGDSVAAGALIARIDPAPYELQAQQAEASLRQAEAAARNAEANYERVKGLYENSNASRNDLDTARSASESAQAQTRAAQKALELARLNVSYTRLTASGACSVASVEVEINENVSQGAPVAVVNCGDAFEVSLDVPESLIALIERGMSCSVTFAAIPVQTFLGHVSEVGVAASANAATYPVIVRIAEEHPELRAGLAAEVAFDFPREGNAAAQLLPVAAVAEDADGSFVWIAAADGDNEAVVTRRAVTLGELTEDGVEVIDGLEPGERVITAGVSVVRAGQRVLLQRP